MVRLWCLHLIKKRRCCCCWKLNCRSCLVWYYVRVLNQSGGNSRKCILLKKKASSWLSCISLLLFMILLLHLSIHGVLYFANPGAVVTHCARSLLQGMFSFLLVHCCTVSVRKQECHSFGFMTRNVNCWYATRLTIFLHSIAVNQQLQDLYMTVA